MEELDLIQKLRRVIRMPPLVLSFILKGKINILQPVGWGNLDVSVVTSVFLVGLTPTRCLSGNSIFGFPFDANNCSVIFLLLFF